MNKKLRKFLESNGLRAEATEQEAWELYDELKGRGIELVGVDPGQRADTGGQPGNGNAAGDRGNQDEGEEAPGSGKRSYSKEEINNLIAAQTVQALANDASRRNDVQNMIDVAGVAGLDNGDFARSLIDNPQVDAARASQLILTELQKRNTPIGVGAHASVGRESGEKLRAAITDGLLARSGHRLEKPADGYREFRGRHLTEICRDVLESAGISTRGLGKREMVGRALSSGSASDFPLILGALVNRNLQQAYQEWPSTWRPFVSVGTATDFKQMFSLKLSGAPDLQPLNENGEYKTAAFAEAGENYRVVTRGIKVPLTREMIINDDLRAFTRIPQLFGTAAKRMESDAVYALITANGNMADGIPLFDALHSNLAAVNAAITSASLDIGRAAMRRQTGLNGEAIDIIPAFILTPVVLELTAEILLRSASLPNANMSEGVHNPWAGKLTPIADPHLDANSLTSWYLLGHPNQAPTIEVAWLEGEEMPYVEEMVDFNSDALVTKVRHDFGAGVVDHVGGFMNIGV